MNTNAAISTNSSQQNSNMSKVLLNDLPYPTLKKNTEAHNISTLRKMSDAFEEKVCSRGDIYRVNVELLYVQEGFNLREIDTEHAGRIKNSYVSGVYVPPIVVKVITVDNLPRLQIIDGHHRYCALRMAMEEGCTIKGVYVTEFSGSQQLEIVNMLTSSEGKPLAPLEKADGFHRLLSMGWDKKEVARYTNTSVVTINRLLRLFRADYRITDLVRKNLITSDLAIEILLECEETNQEAYDVIIAGLQKATDSGKNKVTRKFVPSAKKVPFSKKEIHSVFSQLSEIRTTIHDKVADIQENDETVTVEMPVTIVTLLNDVLQKFANDESTASNDDENEPHETESNAEAIQA
ncbi:TPA: ParB/RepB/Spo0J family partition protein [Proteus mirabilis]|nr:ParB/RepB/Spo0J family partition protein [Proteus mirabilis]